MQRTCNTCQIVYGAEHVGMRFCSNCGEKLPPMPEPSMLSPETSRGTSPDDDDADAHIKSGGWSSTPLGDERFPQIHPGPVISDVAYPPLPVESKSPALAALLSFLLVGMGQVYLGQVEKGLLMLGVMLFLILTTVLGPLGLVLLLLNVFDAFMLARKIKEGKRIRKWEFFFSTNRADGANQ